MGKLTYRTKSGKHTREGIDTRYKANRKMAELSTKLANSKTITFEPADWAYRSYNWLDSDETKATWTTPYTPKGKDNRMTYDPRTGLHHEIAMGKGYNVNRFIKTHPGWKKRVRKNDILLTSSQGVTATYTPKGKTMHTVIPNNLVNWNDKK